MPQPNVSPLTPEARDVARRAAEVYLRHTAPWFVGLLVHGSALKGGFIPGCSDIDFKLYLADDAFAPDGQLPLPVAMAIHRDLATIDPAPFAYLQCYAGSVTGRTDWVLGPVPGAYHMVAGTLPVPEATADEAHAAAHAGLAGLTTDRLRTPSALLQHGAGKLERTLRLLCTDVWPALFNVAVVRSSDPLAVWRMRKDDVIVTLDADDELGLRIRRFDALVRQYYVMERTVPCALSALEAGLDFLKAAHDWYRASPL